MQNAYRGGFFGLSKGRVIIPAGAVDMRTPIRPSLNSQEIRARTLKNIRVADNPPKMILIVGPCRAGTTALSNVFIRAGLPSDMQPIKSMRRAIEEGQEVIPWDINRDGGDMVLVKETLGPKTGAEFFNPIEILSAAGFPLSELHLIGICREPRATLGSWVNMWGTVPLAGFVESYRLLNRIMEYASAHGVGTTHYVQEAIGTVDPAEVVRELMERTRVIPTLSARKLVTWKDGPVFGRHNPNIHFFDEPPDKFVQGVTQGTGYAYRVLTPVLNPPQDNAIREAGLYDIYRRFAEQCEQDLGISILEPPQKH